MSSISSRLILLNDTKKGIRNAVINKGGTYSLGVTFSGYNIGIDSISLRPNRIWSNSYQEGILGLSRLNEWVRPSDWLVIPTLTINDQRIVGLVAVSDNDSNFLSLSVTIIGGGAQQYRVDWGDGFNTLHTTGITAEYKYNYNTILNSTLSVLGYKQVLVTITPATGSFATVSFSANHSISATSSNQWLDIYMVGNTITSFTFQPQGPSYPVSTLERFRFLGTNSITNFSNTFFNCIGLESIELDTSNATNVNAMFATCSSLENVPLFNTSKVTTFTSMFGTCRSLRTIPSINTSLGTNFSSMFSSCSSLVTIPTLNTSLCNNFNSMFSNCNSLTSIPGITTSLGTNFNSMFNNCFSLQNIPNLNTSLATNCGSMFSSCNILSSIPNLNLSNVTDMSSMFFNCNNIEWLPTFNNPLCTTVQNTFNTCGRLRGITFSYALAAGQTGAVFASCVSLQQVNITGTNSTNFNSSFNGCVSLRTFSMSVPSVNNFSNAFTSCRALRSVTLTGNNNTSVNGTSMFTNCHALESVETTFGSMLFSDINSMFLGCHSLKRLPVNFNTSNVTIFTAAFGAGSAGLGVVSLQTIPKFILATASSGFGLNALSNVASVNMNSPLREVPDIDFNNYTSAISFSNFLFLRRFRGINIRQNLTLTSSGLSRVALVEIFNNLAVVTPSSRTITISFTYGASSLSVAERQIATDKGWVIVG